MVMVRLVLLVVVAVALTLVAGEEVVWDCPGAYNGTLAPCSNGCPSGSSAEGAECKARCKSQAVVERDECFQQAAKWHIDHNDPDTAEVAMYGINDSLRRASAAHYIALAQAENRTMSVRGMMTCAMIEPYFDTGSGCGNVDDGTPCGNGTGVCVGWNCVALASGGSCPEGSGGVPCGGGDGVCHHGLCMATIELSDSCDGKKDGDSCSGGAGACLLGKCVAVARGFPECESGQGGGTCNSGLGICIGDGCAHLVWSGETIDTSCRDMALADGTLVADDRGMCWGGHGLEVHRSSVEGCSTGGGRSGDGKACAGGNGICLSGGCARVMPLTGPCGGEEDGAPCPDGPGVCGSGHCLEILEGGSCGTDGEECGSGLGVCVWGSCLELSSVFDGCDNKTDDEPCNYLGGRCLLDKCVRSMQKEMLKCQGDDTDGRRCANGGGICKDGLCLPTFIDEFEECTGAEDGTPCAERMGTCWSEACLRTMRRPRDPCASARIVTAHRGGDGSTSDTTAGGNATGLEGDLTSLSDQATEAANVTKAEEWVNGASCDGDRGVCIQGRCIDVAPPLECTTRPDMAKCDDLEGRCVDGACVRGIRFMPVGPGEFDYERVPIPYFEKYETEESLIQRECLETTKELANETLPVLRPCLLLERNEQTKCIAGNARYYRTLNGTPEYFLEAFECNRFANRNLTDACLNDPAKIVYSPHRVTPGDSCDLEPPENITGYGMTYFRRSLCQTDLARAFARYRSLRTALEECGRINYTYLRTRCLHLIGSMAYGNAGANVSISECGAQDAQCYYNAAIASSATDPLRAICICHKIELQDSPVPCVDAVCLSGTCPPADEGLCEVGDCGDPECIPELLGEDSGRELRDRCYREVLDVALPPDPGLEAELVCTNMITSPQLRIVCLLALSQNVVLDRTLGGFPRAVNACGLMDTSEMPEARDGCFLMAAGSYARRDPYVAVTACRSIQLLDTLAGCVYTVAEMAMKWEMRIIKKETGIPYNTVVKACTRGDAAEGDLRGWSSNEITSMCIAAFDRVRTICDHIPDDARRLGCLYIVEPIANLEAPPDLMEHLKGFLSTVGGEYESEAALLAYQKVEQARTLHRASTDDEARLVAGELIRRAEDALDEASYEEAIRLAEQAIKILEDAVKLQASGFSEYAITVRDRDPEALRKEAGERIREAEELYELSYGPGMDACDPSIGDEARAYIREAWERFNTTDYIRSIKSAKSAIVLLSGLECHERVEDQLVGYRKRVAICERLVQEYDMSGDACLSCDLCDDAWEDSAIWRCLVRSCIDREKLLGAICERYCSARPLLEGCSAACTQCSKCAESMTDHAQDSCVAACVSSSVINIVCSKLYNRTEDVMACSRCDECLVVAGNLTTCLEGCMARKPDVGAIDDVDGEVDYDLGTYLENQGIDAEIVAALGGDVSWDLPPDQATSGPSAIPKVTVTGDVTEGEGTDGTVSSGATPQPRVPCPTPREDSDRADDGDDNYGGYWPWAILLLVATLLAVAARMRKLPPPATPQPTPAAAAPAPLYYDYKSYYGARQYQSYDYYLQQQQYQEPYR